jgi:hypothetical protein
MTPQPEEVRRIAAVAAPALRNLQITECYARLAAAMAEREPGGANWCTFATWASRQAGRTIRGEDMLEHLRAELGRGGELLHPIASLWRALLRRGLLHRTSRLGRITAALHTPFDAVELASDAVARGNRKVFAEIGLEFARYLHECAPDAPEIQSFLDSLTPGEPPDGKRYLRQAFQHYQRQSAEPGANARAQLLLTANLEIGLHEQTRLQPEIREALDAPYDTQQDLGRRLLELLFPRGTRTRRAIPDPVATRALGWTAGRIERTGAELARSVITRSLMVLSLPGRVLYLGTHLGDPYPEALQAITDQDLETLITRFEPIAPAADDCGAQDWSVLEQRMHFILHLFRSWHEHPDLLRPPFTAAQLARMSSGAIPDGDL